MTDFSITDLVVGDGKQAERGALITAHYTGYLADGTVFDSSHKRGQPFECVIGTGRVIKGWDLGVLGSEIGAKFLAKWGIEMTLPDFSPMKIGGKRQLIVPAHLAYGERTVGQIPPNSDLTFEIELLEVKTRD
ncbi:MAG: FKBP-type peptidyl-prolyl cis-trans isomerase [Moraxella sp.]|uniref:FKBP-type peptidyl-prolyl cis-trans isomerase n=1 Tax=Moraxella sp. TaxID=479 RepID=UPI0026DCB8ED|nr:FKBP-type peptidyl-prolyl cis-trans isomerase [Moraxella sp.]MDO4451179.1 FKBP-type peptidyl-prolyl cis-trans isomerase [Moraxella sp.]